ncbi:T9SS type A sorting domain-containing protein [Flavobacterium sp. 83]|uniref:DUF7619 domain-containing protein n=1 Tax=Flavobacterium sp. 83 TaxID=1131812 RepID=UPI0005592096|nr:T9SS type A sorting domain-containing protein [Flavobacterium sp. 83]
MKIYFLVIALLVFKVINAQIINIPDVNFKNKLLRADINNDTAKNLSGNFFKIDANNDGEIQVEEASQVSLLNLVNYSILNLEGILNFKNIKSLDCYYNSLSSINLDGLIHLESLDLSTNYIKSLDVSSLKNLKNLNLHQNELELLNVSGLPNLLWLDCGRSKLASLDVSSSTNLEQLICSENQISELNISGLSKLRFLDCYTNKLTTLNLTNSSSLTHLRCEGNNLTSLNCENLKELTYVQCFQNKISTLDFSSSKNLTHLMCFDNQLISIIAKTSVLFDSFWFYNNPNLKYICVDTNNLDYVKGLINQLGYSNCEVNTYCTFTPGGEFYLIKGISKVDIDNNGCDVNDIIFPNLNFSITNGTNKGNIISNAMGNYSIPVQDGTHTITPVLENASYFNISPSSVNVTFPTQSSPFAQDFCITPNGVHNDLEINVLPTIPARPGFDATYKIIYKNKGNTSQSGSVALTFNDAVLDYVSAVPNVNRQITDKISWDYSNLLPFETRTITVTLNVNSPMEIPSVNIGDRLSFNALINPVTGDEKPVDNSSALRQSVVGSFDPNDKTCLEGDVITPDLIGEYVHYLIRFENTGTYAAQNIVVKDLIDLTKFDISTLVPTKASHDFVTKISDGNKVEFIFENINLSFNNATNDGHIAFKIKTLPTLVVGDSFANEANIYFDYNFPILTNKATSTFKTLETQDFEFGDYFSVYPNPVNDILNIGIKNVIQVKSMAVYDILGQLIIAVPDAQTVSKIDVSKLTIGNYFLKMNTNKGTSSVKFIKQ